MDIVLPGRVVELCTAATDEEDDATERFVTKASRPGLVLVAPGIGLMSAGPGLPGFITMGFLTTMIREG